MASAVLEFQYAQGGKINRYRVTRRWHNNGGAIEESLVLEKKTGRSKRYVGLDGIDDAHTQAVINQMIPRAVASLFFFDGERIEDIAESGGEHAYIKSSFDSMLGLGIPEKLHEDVGLYHMRNSSGDEGHVLKELESMTEEKEAAERKLAQTQERRVFLNGEMSRRHKDLEQKESEFFRLGGTFAQARGELVEEKNRLEEQKRQSEDLLRGVIEGDLALSIIPERLERVRDEISSDEAKIRKSLTGDAIGSAFEGMIGEMEQFLNVYKPKIKKEVISKLHDIADARVSSGPSEPHTAFDFSLSEMTLIKERIGQVLGRQYGHARGNYSAHKDCLEKLAAVSAKLDVVPQHDEVGPLYSDIKAITLEIGEMEQEHHTLERLEGQEKSRITLLNAKIRKLLSEKKMGKRNQRGMEMIPLIQQVLDDYLQRLRTRKITLLEANILEGIKRCFHKTRLITGVSVDPKTYRVTLHDENGEVLKSTLSKGEMQLYTTAIVWGMAKTSGRPLPFVIDTPLARLDAKHRENMVENFYPEASHQTIIFSTNTEVAGASFETLKPYISKACVIRYDAREAGSTVGNGYFEGGGTDEP